MAKPVRPRRSDAQGDAAARAHGSQDESEVSLSGQDPFADVRVEGDGFSIPELKWRELLFVGALRAEGEHFRRDPLRPLPPFQDPNLFPEGALFRATRIADRVRIERL